jgi:fucose permease
VAGLFIAGLGVANLFPMSLSVATGVAAEQANRASARLSMGSGLAIMTAPLILGWTADQIGLQGAFAIVVLLFALAGAVAVTANAIARGEEEETEGTMGAGGTKGELGEPREL